MVAVEVHAAGGVVRREASDGTTEVLIVHRPKYDDWSLPKGKLDDAESFEEAALREVEEETGWRCRLGRELPTVRYHDRAGRRKIVRYWLMTPTEFTGFTPNEEIDAAPWLDAREAARLLTYDADRRLLAQAGEPRS